MKITRKNKTPITTDTTTCSSMYQDSLDHIRCAIDCLGSHAQEGDQLAKDAIANLGVVMLDLS